MHRGLNYHLGRAGIPVHKAKGEKWNPIMVMCRIDCLVFVAFVIYLIILQVMIWGFNIIFQYI